MDFQDLGAIGEFISSVAIVTTLVFLTLETRQARNATQQSNRQARHRIRTDINLAMAVNPQLTEVLAKTSENPAGEFGLSHAEQIQLSNYFLLFFRHIEDQFFSDIPETDRFGLETQARRALSIPVFSAYWERFKESFESRFQEYVDGLKL